MKTTKPFMIISLAIVSIFIMTSCTGSQGVAGPDELRDRRERSADAVPGRPAIPGSDRPYKSMDITGSFE